MIQNGSNHRPKLWDVIIYRIAFITAQFVVNTKWRYQTDVIVMEYFDIGKNTGHNQVADARAVECDYSTLIGPQVTCMSSPIYVSSPL